MKTNDDVSICWNCKFHATYVKKGIDYGGQSNFGPQIQSEKIVGHYCMKGLYGTKTVEGTILTHENPSNVYPPQVTECNQFENKGEKTNKSQLND